MQSRRVEAQGWGKISRGRAIVYSNIVQKIMIKKRKPKKKYTGRDVNEKVKIDDRWQLPHHCNNPISE